MNLQAALKSGHTIILNGVQITQDEANTYSFTKEQVLSEKWNIVTDANRFIFECKFRRSTEGLIYISDIPYEIINSLPGKYWQCELTAVSLK